MRLNLGAGDLPAPVPWLNVDQFASPGVRPDVQARAADLPFADGSAEAVYCGHVLEHLEFGADLPSTLREIRRVLSPGGEVCFVGPDYDRALANPEWHPLLPGIVDGGDRWPGDRHKWLSSGARTLGAVREVFDAEEVDIFAIPEWPVATPTGWQFAIVGR